MAPSSDVLIHVSNASCANAAEPIIQPKVAIAAPFLKVFLVFLLFRVASSSKSHLRISKNEPEQQVAANNQRDEKQGGCPDQLGYVIRLVGVDDAG